MPDLPKDGLRRCAIAASVGAAAILCACSHSDSSSSGVAEEPRQHDTSAISTGGVDSQDTLTVGIRDTVEARVIGAESKSDDAAASWRIATQWTAGVADGSRELTFGNITNLGIGPDGRIYAIDFTHQHIVVLTSDGHFVRTIGRQGRGPGEFDGLLAMAWDDRARLWVADGWNRRYTIIDTTGALIGTVPRSITGASGWSQSLHFIDRDRLLDQTAETVRGRFAIRYIEVDTSGAVRDSFPVIQARETVSTLTPSDLYRIRNVSRALPQYTPRTLVAPTTDGSVWIVETDTYGIVRRTLEGDTTLAFRPTHRTADSAPELDRIRQQLRAAGLEVEDLPFGQQLVRSIHVMDDGHLLLLVGDRSTPALDVFAPDGS